MANLQIQPAGFLLELSPDWLIQRASENAHGFLGEYHQRLVGNQLADVTMAQPLHDLRNSLARQKGVTGIARAYRVRLFDDPRRFDFAFQALDAVILLEGLPSPDHGVGDWLGSVGRLADGLRGTDRHRTMEGAARRMRALTGFDRATVTIGDEQVESVRGSMPPLDAADDLPAIIADVADPPLALFPHEEDGPSAGALLRAPSHAQCEALRSAGIASLLRVPIISSGEEIGEFRCDSRRAMQPSFELHAAAELFAQIFGMAL